MSLYDSLSCVPVFPLPSAVLMPEASMSFVVFEERYRRMVRDVIKGNRILVIALLKPGWQKDYFGAPEMHSIACAGELVEYDLPDNDVYTIVVHGLSRVRIERDVHLLPYRQIQASVLDEPTYPHGCPSIDSAVQLLKQLVDEFIQFVPEQKDKLRRLIPLKGNAGELADLSAAHLLRDIGVRQRVLEAVDLKFRLSIVNATLASIVLKASFLRGGGYRTPTHPRLN